MNNLAGLALIDKPINKTSFYLISFLRRLTAVRCIVHAGTLDPFATGVMVLLVGKPFTAKSDQLIGLDKEYVAKLKLGITTDSYDCDGSIIETSNHVPTLSQVQAAIEKMQGTLAQIPPMFSAKKINGQKLYELARQGKTIAREPKQVQVKTQLLSYNYPFVDIHVQCSSGTYIRTIGHDIGQDLGCGAHLVELIRTRVGPFNLQECQKCDQLLDPSQLNLRHHW